MIQRHDSNAQGLSAKDADQLGVLVALPLTESAAQSIRRVLALTSPQGSTSRRSRGLASPKRGGAVTGSVAAPPLRLTEGLAT